ncbi:hypothetical protein DT075_23010 [Bacillus licheniformis]|nr:hypothetical protein DT075_23010 [Bacillus licheniformis]
MQNDPYGANAAVVADPDTVNRLRAMGREIQAGRPVKGILDELAAIVGRVLPEVPNDATDNQQTNPTNSAQEPVNREDGQAISRRLVKITESVPGVNDATAVVLGRLSVVGIDVKDNLERSKVESIKYSVAEALVFVNKDRRLIQQ